MFTVRSEMNLYIQFMFTLVYKELVLLDIAYNEICHIHTYNLCKYIYMPECVSPTTHI